MERPERRVVLGVTWQSNEQGITPQFRTRDDNASESRLIPIVGSPLTYRAGPESRRVCIGHKPFRSSPKDYIDCNQSPQPGSRTCRSCAVVEATFASNLHHAHTKETLGVDPDIAAHLRQPNLLYLAGFRDGSIKVGTSTEKRIETRLLEQGAWQAHIVGWAADGVVVRLLEDWVTEKLDIPQSVSARRKLRGLETPVRTATLSETLAQSRAQVHELIERSGEERLRVLHTEWGFPKADDEHWDHLHRYPTSLATGAHDLEVIDASGRLLVVRRPGASDLFAADPQPLYGIELEWGNFGSEPLAVQDSLF